MENEVSELLEEREKEHRKDKLNTLVAISVTLLVTFSALCKINDNNIVLSMHQTQANKVDSWSWYQSLNVREDITQSKITDYSDDLQEEDVPAKRKGIETKINAYKALAQKIADKKEQVKKKAEENEKRYDKLDEIHEQFDRSEAFISIAISLLALTVLLEKRIMLGVALFPAAFGIFKGIMGLLG